MTVVPVEIEVTYNHTTLRGSFRRPDAEDNAIWERITQRALAIETDYDLSAGTLDLPWSTALSVIREFAPLQRKQAFQFRPIGIAKDKVAQFVRDYKAVQQSRGTLTESLDDIEIESRLRDLSFTKRALKNFQKDDLRRLLAPSNGA